MGKTSLIYQLASEPVNGPYVPVIVDLQGQSLDTMEHLFAGLALGICKDVQRHWHITIEEPDREAFAANPIEALMVIVIRLFLLIYCIIDRWMK